MTKRFEVSVKKLSRRYGSVVLRLCILPVCVLLTLLVITLLNGKGVMPIKYYFFLFITSAACTGYLFVVLLVGSALSDIRLSGHKKHTYVELTDNRLLVSRFVETSYSSDVPTDYKELNIIKLSDIEDVYPFKKTVIIAADTRKITGQSEWLKYKAEGTSFEFERNWCGDFTGKLCGGVEIPDMYDSPKEIAEAVEAACGSSKNQVERRQAFREYMLSVTQSEAYKKARRRIRR